MLILTTTGLSVGAIVSERRQVQRAFDDAQERIKKKENRAIQAGRFNLVTAMASALAHSRLLRRVHWCGQWNIC
jgi:two-component system, LuxR family, sensor kinase FixL